MKKNLLFNRVRGYLVLNSKVLRVMRLTFYLSLLTIFQSIAGNSYSQSTGLSFDLNDAKLSDPVETLSEQKRSVSGVVKDESGELIPGVTVIIKGSTRGTVTDINGRYKLDMAEGDKILSFAFVGMISQDVPIGTSNEINAVMTIESTGVDEVVVVGYGVQKKVTSTGSIVTTKGADLMKSPSVNLTNNLIGRLPGLTAVTRSGEPGADGATLRIRGSNTLGDNSPLIVVDGVANRGMERLNPSDIESLTILKDASAAIYGSQAANGVILITTKRGAIGKPKVTLSMNAGVSQPTRIPKMADAAQYASMLNEVNYYKDPKGGRNSKYSIEDIQKYSDGSDPWGHPNTDWFGEVFRPWSTQNQQNASLSGGTENMKYFISLGAKFADGIYKNSATSYKQYDFRTNIDGKVNKYIDVAFDVAGREEIRDYPTRSVSSVFRMLMRGKPNMPAYWPDGTPGPDIEYGDNPAVTSTSATGYDLGKTYVLESNLRTNIAIPWISGLSVTANASFDKSILFHKKFETPWYLYTWDGNADHVTTKGKRGLDSPQLSQDMSDGQRIALNVYATYEKTIASIHNVKLMAGTERRNGMTDFFSAFRKNYISSAVDQLFVGATDQYMSNSGSADQNAYLSYFGRVNYDLNQKYMIEFVWRYDGSYKFPVSKQFGFFPGISAGWRISNENFWKNNITFINDFKIRGSWGQTGNDRIDPYQYLATYGGDINNDGKIDGSDNRSYVFGGIDGKLLYETKIPNPDVTWEIANQANIGLDAQLFNSKFSVSADYFNNIRSQILIRKNASIPSSTGFTLPPENIGKVENRGFEGSLMYHGNAGGFEYDLSVNGSYSKNKILFWDETPGIPSYQQSTGKPIPTYNNDSKTFNSDLYYQAIGIYKDQAQIDATPHWAGAQPGDVIFEDVGGLDGVPDGVINGLDRVRSEKNNMPRFIGGFNANLRFMNFDLSLLIQGAKGSQQYVRAESGEIGNYYKEYADNRWTPENINASYPRAWNRDEDYWGSQGNTFWLQNMDYVRLKNFELGYSFSSRLNKSLGIAGFRIYVNGQNLYTLSNVKLIDPEQESGQSYPLQRVVNGGITLTF